LPNKQIQKHLAPFVAKKTQLKQTKQHYKNNTIR